MKENVTPDESRVSLQRRFRYISVEVRRGRVITPHTFIIMLLSIYTLNSMLIYLISNVLEQHSGTEWHNTTC